MSAFVVSKQHIDVLVWLAFTGPHREVGSSHWMEPSWMRQHHPTPDELGRLLLAENVASVSHRYPQDRADELPGPRPPYWLVSEAGEGGYCFVRQPYVLTAVEGLKAVGCYAYQSCEHPEWEESPAHAFCQSLEQTLIAALPGMDAAPWCWDAAAVAACASAASDGGGRR